MVSTHSLQVNRSEDAKILWISFMDVPKRCRRRMKERRGNTTTTTTANIAVDGPAERGREEERERDLSSLSLSISAAQGTPEIGEGLAHPESDHPRNNKRGS